MTERSWMVRLLAFGVMLALVGPWFPARAAAESAPAGLNGVIRSADRSPLAGARLLATDAEGQTVHRSEPSSEDGAFTLTGMQSGTYRLAVELDAGLYLVKTPVYLVGGVQRTIQVAVGADGSVDQGALAEQPVAGAWNNPWAAGGMVLGFAIAVGVLVKNATDDELTSTEFENN